MKQLELSLFYKKKKKKNHVTRLYSVKLRSSKHRVLLSGNPPLRPPLDRGPSTSAHRVPRTKNRKIFDQGETAPCKTQDTNTTSIFFFLFFTLFRHFCFPFALILTRGK